MSALTVVLYDAVDCARWERERPAIADAFLPLTPSATAALLNSGRQPLAPLACDAPEAHLRDAELRRDTAAELERGLRAAPGLTVSGGQALVDFAADACGTASRLRTALHEGRKWLVPYSGGWLTTNDRDEAAATLLRRFFAPWNECDLVRRFGRTPCALRWRLHRRNVELLKLVARSRPVAFNAFSRGFARLAEELHAADPDVYLLSFNPVDAEPAALDYVRTWREYVATNAPVRPRQITLPVPPRRMPRRARLARSILSRVTDPTARLGIAAYLPTILTQVQWVESVVPSFERYLRAGAARAVLAWDHADRLNAALAEGAKRAGIPSVAACHTSISPSFDEPTRVAKLQRTRRLGGGPLADLALVQSPAAEEAVREASPELPQRRVRPFVWGLQRVEPCGVRRPASERIVLHAGNYFEWGGYLPWAYETSNDFVASLRALCEATAKVANTRLIVRMKSNFGRKGEFDRAALTTLIRPGPHWEIREGGDFAEDLAQADLVVSAHSTTVEEALLARRPVLLWGCDQRYRHVRSRETPPDERSRGAVYFPPRSAEAADWLERILAAHADRPLSDAELVGYVWRDGEAATLPDVARQLLDGFPQVRPAIVAHRVAA